MIARIYKKCGRCGQEQREESWIVDDGHGYGVCMECADELELKRNLRNMAYGFAKCDRCKKLKPKTAYSEEMQRRMVWTKNYFTHAVSMPKGAWCQTCEVEVNQIVVAKDAEAKLKTRAVMSLVSGSRLRKKHLPDELIETKITQMKVLNLWQTPKT